MMISTAMPATVRLDEIVDALEIQFDESSSFLDLNTGEVETVSHDLLRQAEESSNDEEPDIPEWQKQEWELAKRFVSSDRFQNFPRSSMFTSGRSCKISHARFKPTVSEKSFYTPFTAAGHSGVSRTPSGSIASSQPRSHSGQRP